MELPYEPMKKNYNSFKTKEEAFMTAFPDIQLEETKTSTIANALLKNDEFSIMLLLLL
jgi:hypothetical protein